MLLPHDPWLALPLAWLAFFAAGAAVRRAVPGGGRPWRVQAVFEGTLVALVLAVARVEGLSLAALGLVRPERGVWGAACAGGLALGVATTFAMLGTGRSGAAAAVRRYSFAERVLVVWIGATVSEELFCRGWFQGSTGDGGSDLAALLPSALLFGGLHLSLWFAGADLASTGLVVAATTLLGLLAAWARAASGSLYPAIAAHGLFNVGGVLGGIAWTLGRYLRTGELPDRP